MIEDALTIHEGHAVSGKILQTTYVEFDIEGGELVPKWSSERLIEWETNDAYCNDCDVVIVGQSTS